MEISNTASESTQRENQEYTPGTAVIYGLHGLCNVVSIETRVINQQTMKFYRLERQRSALSRSQRQDPAIWLPVEAAKNKGLRTPIREENEVQTVLSILSNREYYFSTKEPFAAIQPKLESCIKKEGAIGLAKTLSHLLARKRMHVIPPSDITKMFETIKKLLIKELVDATGKNSRILENEITHLMRHKLTLDN